MSPQETNALVLSTLAGLATTVGAGFAVIRRPGPRLLAFLLGLAFGVMASLSVVEMWLRNASENGPLYITLCVAAGAAAFVALHLFIPDGDWVGVSVDERDSGCEAVTGRDDSTASDGGGAGISDREGSRGTKEGQGKTGRLSGGERARGVGDAVSTSKPPSVVAHAAKSSPRGQSRRELLRLGLLMAFTMTAHNLPEGVAVGVSAFTPLGPIMALAIAVHNVPEGVIVAAPVFAATGSRTRALLAATASGLSEPLGALLAVTLLRSVVTEEWLEGLLAFVGGIMLAVCVMELWPEGRKCGHDGALVKGAALGATAMLWTLWVGV